MSDSFWLFIFFNMWIEDKTEKYRKLVDELYTAPDWTEYKLILILCWENLYNETIFACQKYLLDNFNYLNETEVEDDFWERYVIICENNFAGISAFYYGAKLYITNELKENKLP